MANSDVDSLIALHTAFWNRTLPRPIINVDCSMAARTRHVPALPPQWADQDGLLLQPAMLTPEVFQPAPATMKGPNPLHGEVAFNSMFPYSRVPWLVGIMGGATQVSTTSETVWPVHTLPDDWYKLPNQGFTPRLEWLDKLLEFERYFVQRFYPAQGLPSPDVIGRGPGDLLLAILGPQQLYFGFYDHPQEIKRLLDRITDLYIRWGRAQFAVIPRFHGGYCNPYGIWSPGSCVRSQEDHAINLSPRIFKEFLLPTVRKVADAFEYEVFHTHSGFPALAEWVLEVENLRAIEVGLDPKSPPLDEQIALWNRILERKNLIIMGPVSERVLDRLVSSLSPGGLWLDVQIVPEDQSAEATWAWAKD